MSRAAGLTKDRCGNEPGVPPQTDVGTSRAPLCRQTWGQAADGPGDEPGVLLQMDMGTSRVSLPRRTWGQAADGCGDKPQMDMGTSQASLCQRTQVRMAPAHGTVTRVPPAGTWVALEDMVQGREARHKNTPVGTSGTRGAGPGQLSGAPVSWGRGVGLTRQQASCGGAAAVAARQRACRQRP